MPDGSPNPKAGEPRVRFLSGMEYLKETPGDLRALITGANQDKELVGALLNSIQGFQSTFTQRPPGMSGWEAVGMMVGPAAEVGAAAIIASDRRLKKNSIVVGKAPSGLSIYEFEYKDPRDGVGRYRGVMADEVPRHAVVSRGDYDAVDYSQIDVDFERVL